MKFTANETGGNFSETAYGSAFFAQYEFNLFYLQRGNKHYELTNHLGNVLTVITDKRLLSCMGDTIQSSFANIVSATDYSPFGAPLAGRTFTAKEYRFGFNGKEKDDETYGDGNAYDFGARIYDARKGSWLSVDSRFAKYPDLSPYVYSENNPLIMVDNGGDSTIYYTARGNKLWVSHDGLDNAIVIVNDKDLIRFRRNVETFKALKVGDGAVANEHLRKMGTVYPIEQFENFFNHYSRKHVGGGIRRTSQGDIVTNIIVGNEVSPVYDEYAVPISRIGNTLCINGAPNPGSPDNSAATGGDTTAHLHPEPRGEQVTLVLLNRLGLKSFLPYTFKSGPSDNDKDNVGKERNVVIDNKSIDIYGQGDKKSINFDRTIRFSKDK